MAFSNFSFFYNFNLQLTCITLVSGIQHSQSFSVGIPSDVIIMVSLVANSRHTKFLQYDRLSSPFYTLHRMAYLFYNWNLKLLFPLAIFTFLNPFPFGNQQFDLCIF